jgi:hypothetical protein
MTLTMFKIECNFERDSGRDAIDPLGGINISDGNSTLVLKNVYLDSAFAALIQGLSELRIQDHASVEILEEPNPLRFDAGANATIRISYGNQEILAPTRDSLETALRKGAKTFLSALSDLPDSQRSETLEAIRKFCVWPAETT